MADTTMPNGLTLIEDPNKSLQDAINSMASEFSAMQEVLDNSSDSLAEIQNNTEKKKFPTKEESKIDFSKIKDFFEKSSSDIVSSILGPLNLITEPLKEVGIDIIGGIKNKAAGFFKEKETFPTPERNITPPSLVEPVLENTVFPQLTEDTILSNEKLTPDKSTLLTKGGAIGAAAVYIGNVFESIFGKGAPEEAGAGGLADKLGIDIPTSGFSKALTAGLIATPALIGLGVAAALKKEDILGGIQEFRAGERLKGLETILLGSRERITEENAGRGIGRQGLAYGAAALGVGTTAGLVGAASAAGGIGALGLGGALAAVGPALVAAFPPALIVAGIAALAKGVQTAWVNEWDTRSEEIIEQTRAVLADDEATWLDKTKAVLGTVGKAILGGIVGGLKEIGSEFSKKMENVKAVLGDDEASFTDKALVLINEFNPLTLMNDTIGNYLKGSYAVIGDYLKKALPQRVLNIFMNIGDLVETIYDKSIGKILQSSSSLVSKGAESVGSFFSSSFDYVKETAQGLFERSKASLESAPWFSKTSEVISSVGGFFGDFFSVSKDFIMEKFNQEKADIVNTEWYQTFSGGLEKIKDFFGDLFGSIFELVSGQFEQAKAGVTSLAAEASFGTKSLSLSKEEQAKLSQLVEGSFGGDVTQFTEAFKASGLGGRFNLKGYGQIFDDAGNIKPEALENLLSAKDNISVNDAIITKEGQVVQTHEDDNIIATKNQPTFLNNEMSELSAPLIIPETTTQLSMLEELKRLVQIMETKSFNNLIVSGSNGSSINLDSIRGNR